MFLPKALIKSGLLAIYCRASKSDRVVGLEVVEVVEVVELVEVVGDEVPALESEVELEVSSALDSEE